ncbi:MAG: DNA repair exonuclease [Nanoarchaeota archaeon]|jgi:exonuclease SbcD|nr:DNA repair exonuclease [Nanoarchaeota archaeon]
MVKFAHLADIHLGGWRQAPMQELNFQAFQFAVRKSIERKVNFILIAGDLFDSAYPPIEILKETFSEFRKLKEAKIPVFIIAGSHDYSVSGKSFLDVLEKAGFCTNVHNSEEIEENILLTPTIHESIAIYGYPGKKSGLEVQDIRRIKLSEAPGMMKIVMLHTTLDKVRGILPIECVEADNLPDADYYAMGHIHVDFRYKNIIYPGPIFPNNFQELETLHNGTFFIIDTEDEIPSEKIEIKIKEVEPLDIVVKNTKTATEEIIEELRKKKLENKIILLRLSGELDGQKPSDINYQKIEDFCYESGVYFVLRNTYDLRVKELDLTFEVKNKENLESEVIKNYSTENPSNFNPLIDDLVSSLAIEKQEGETVDSFNQRLIEEAKRILKFE